MSDADIHALVGAIVGLLAALQVWLAARSVSHENQLNGLMGPRITAGATTAIAADHVARAEQATPVAVADIPADPVKAARIAALQAELASLTKPP